MAQTFHANAGTRLHPIEWASGLAAGVSAALMARLKLNSQQVYDHHVETLQQEILKQGGKLEWTLEDDAVLAPYPPCPSRGADEGHGMRSET